MPVNKAIITTGFVSAFTIYSFVKYLIPATFIQRLMAAVNIGYITATASNLYVSSNRITCRLLLRSSLTLFLRLYTFVPNNRK